MRPLIVGIQGEDKTAKTSLALTFPKPLAHLELDIGGFQRSAWRFEKEIEEGWIKSFPLPLDQGGESELHDLFGTKKDSVLVHGYRELWNKLIDTYIGIITGKIVSVHGAYNSVVFDSFSMTYLSAHQGYLQSLQEAQIAQQIANPKANQKIRERLQPIEYTTPFNWMRGLLTTAKTRGKIMVLIHKLEDERKPRVGKDGEVDMIPTGLKVAQGWKDITQWADLMIETSLARSNGTYPKPKAKMVLCGLNLEVIGMEYPEPTWDDIAGHLELLGTKL